MKWLKSSSFIKPKTTDDTISNEYVYIRKNIVKTNIQLDEKIIPYYEYYETLILKDDYYTIIACTLETQDQINENTANIEKSEDAICELSETTEESIAALEQAICDLSEEIGGVI